jgi:hypothetical protein
MLDAQQLRRPDRPTARSYQIVELATSAPAATSGFHLASQDPTASWSTSHGMASS